MKDCALAIFSSPLSSCCSHYERAHCNTTLAVDGPMPVKLNDYTPTQKIDLALNMVEAMALLHNHKEGLIIHGMPPACY